jgi:hypothetical protein
VFNRWTLVMIKGLSGGRSAAIADLLDALHTQFERLIDTGQQIGAIRSDLPLALLTEMAFAAAREADRWSALNARIFHPQDARAINHRVFSLFTSMLAPSDGADASAQASNSYKE